MKREHKQMPGWVNRKKILLFALLVSMAIISLAFYWFENQNKWLEKDYARQTEITVQQDKFDDLFLAIQTAEMAVRGYAGTGNRKFAEDFPSIINSIQVKHKELKEIQNRDNNTVDSLLFTRFDSLVREKIVFIQKIKGLCDADDCTAAVKLLGTEKGIRLTDSILKVHENANNAFQDTLMQSKVIFLKVSKRNNDLAYTGIIAAILLLCIVFYFLFREISRVKKISDELKIRKEHFDVTLSSISEGLITTGKHGEILYMNPAAEKLTGWLYSEVKDQPVQTVYNVVNEETGLPIKNIISRIIKDGEVIVLENNTILKTRHTESLIISNNGAPLLDKEGNISGAVLVFNDITDKKKIEDELKHNETQFRDMIENLPEAVYTCDAEGYIKLYNKAAVKLWNREPVAGKDKWCGSWKIYNTDGTELPFEDCPMSIALREGRPVLGKEVLVERPDGERRHILPSPTPLFNSDGKITGAVNMLIDVTDKKEREILIRKTEEKYRSLIEHASDAILIYSFDGTIHEFNNIICTISGYTREEFAKLRLEDILVGDLIISNEKYTGILSGSIITLYRQFKRKDGIVIDMEIKARMLEDGNILAFGRDVTERNRNEKKLQKAIERYEILSKATSDTIWDWDIRHDLMLYNDGISKMFGYESAEIQNGADWWKNNIHPDDQKKVRTVLDEVFGNRTQTIQFEYRYRSANGAYKNILDRAFVVYDEAGKPVRMIGAMQDITWEKEHERHIAVTIIDTQEKERREIGMELHDNVNQLLSATLLYLGMAVRAAQDKNEIESSIRNCIGYVNEAIADIRTISHRLTPYTKDEVSLKEVIELLVEPISETGEFDVVIDVDEFETDLVSADIQTNLYRILQEQLNNIIKYAKADKIDISIKQDGAFIKLVITDNGIGFEPDSVKKGIGLENIKRRTEIFSGEFTLDSSPGNGCKLIVELPLA